MQAIVARKKERDAKAAREQQAADEVARRQVERRKDAEQQWGVSSRHLDRALALVNTQIDPVGLHLAVEQHDNIAPALAKFFIRLAENGQPTDKTLMFNVNSFGAVQVKASLGLEQKVSPPSFSAGEGDVARYQDILLSFLEAAT